MNPIIKEKKTTETDKTAAALARCLDFIARHQERDGAFTTCSGDASFSRPRLRQAIFPAALILLCLEPLKDRPDAQKIIGKGIDFLLAERSHEWSWNYWRRASAKTRLSPCPDDLDDTSCALAALSIHRPRFITGAALARLVRWLTLAEEAEGGPYHTWLVAPRTAAWSDIDPAVNANIRFLLSLHDISLAPLDAHLERAAASLSIPIRSRDTKQAGQTGRSRYYAPLPILYFISRGYKGSEKGSVEKRALAIAALLKLRAPDGSWGTPLETALAVSALLNFGGNALPAAKNALGPALKYLTDATETESSSAFRAFPLYIEEIESGAPVYCGSPTLSAAFCAEAIARGAEARGDSLIASSGSDRAKAAEMMGRAGAAMRRKVIDMVKSRFHSRSRALKKRADAIIDVVLRKDPGGQIALLPFCFSNALIAPTGRKKPKDAEGNELACRLGAATLFGWMAYRIYDDLLDDEGDPASLPLANIALREVERIYRSVMPLEGQALFEDIMDKIEEANLWERTSCRRTHPGAASGLSDQPGQAPLPAYGSLGVLADKSFGHALGPIALLICRGYAPDSRAVRKTAEFFRHYLIARQLNDDAHDWKSDLDRGFVNSVGTQVLAISKQGDDAEMLQRRFWTDVAGGVSETIISHIDSARRCLRASRVIADSSYLESLLAPVEQAAEEALIERERTVEFLENY